MLKKRIGAGGEGTAYRVHLKGAGAGDQANLAVKECNYSSDSIDKVLSFMNKIYTEFKLVKSLKSDHIIEYKYFLHMCIQNKENPDKLEQ